MKYSILSPDFLLDNGTVEASIYTGSCMLCISVVVDVEIQPTYFGGMFHVTRDTFSPVHHAPHYLTLLPLLSPHNPAGRIEIWLRNAPSSSLAQQGSKAEP